jgi:hypothetical protein
VTITVLGCQHPDVEVVLSFPGLVTQLGARILAEIGGDKTRFATARGANYAGASPPGAPSCGVPGSPEGM